MYGFLHAGRTPPTDSLPREAIRRQNGTVRTDRRPLLEIAVQDAAGAAVARAAGADRVELCTALGVTGGLTPSPGTVESACAAGIDVHVLLRNRPGGFVYSRTELTALTGDVVAAAAAGASGVVIGALDADGRVDAPACRRLLAAARDSGLGVTFHRALDVVADPVAALHVLAELGVDRVLTSGGAASTAAGLDTLRRLIDANTGVQVMAGGGVRVGDIPGLVEIGVDAVHLSARAVVADPGRAGPGGGDDAGLEVTDPTLVREARAALDDSTR